MRIILLIVVLVLAGCSEQVSPENKHSKDTLTDRLVLEQNFEQFQIDQSPQWYSDKAEDIGPFSEGGAYFRARNIDAPPAVRGTYQVDENFQVEIYTRELSPLIFDYLDVVDDPQAANNKTLKIITPKHTDAVILRPTKPLPSHYRVSFRIGYINYGDHTSANGYDAGNETGEPWTTRSATGHNGVYWLAIVDNAPKPHNNIWMHHHRKFVIDSWNRGEHRNSVNVIALDGSSATHPRFGKQFISFVDDEFIRVQDQPLAYYQSAEWYKVSFTRTPQHYQFTLTGRFKNIGRKTYSGRIKLADNCVFHYNQTALELAPHCIDETGPDIGDHRYPNWPGSSAYPDYFVIGEPHINYYEGSVLIDDLKVEYLQ